MKKTASGYRLIFGYLGFFLAMVGAIILLPLILLVVPSFRDDTQYIYAFLIPGLSAIVGGILLAFLLLAGREKAKLKKHQDYVLVVFIWVSAILVSAVPFILSGKMTITESIFESTSGYGTIGLTRLPTAMYDSHVFTFYRALLQFLGGVGLILIVTSAISDRYGLKLYVAEGHTDKLLPNLSKSARLILSIYVGYIALGTLALSLAGVDVFDALCHSISSVATGGFSTKADGMVALSGNMVAIEIITMVLMFLGGTNFVLHMFLLMGKFKKFGRDIEVRTLGIIVLIFVPLFVLSYLAGSYSVGNSFRYGIFTFVTGITTTGFSNVTFPTNPVNGLAIIPYGVTLLLVLTNIIGAGAGSTAGGVKLYRIGVAAKTYFWTLRKRVSSKRIIYPNCIWSRGEKKEIDRADASEALGYIILYIILLFLGSFLVSLLGGFGFGDSLFEFSNALSSTGLSNGITKAINPYSAGGIASMWVMIIGMFAGRLEIVAIFYALYRIARDILRKETI